MEIQYLGQCGFFIKEEGISFAIDPVLCDLKDEDGKERRLYPPVIEPEELTADYIFCTHEHIDHMQISTLQRVIKKHKQTKIIVPYGCVSLLKKSGIEVERVYGIAQKEQLILAKGKLRVGAIQTAHPIHQLDEKGLDRNLAFVFSFGGKTLIHLGDTYLTEQLKADLKSVGKVDVLFSPINGRDEERESQGIIGNMNTEETAKLARFLNAGLTIPTHFDMVRGNTADPKEFVDYLYQKKPSAKYWIPSFEHGLELN